MKIYEESEYAQVMMMSNQDFEVWKENLLPEILSSNDSHISERLARIEALREEVQKELHDENRRIHLRTVMGLVIQFSKW